MTRALLSHDLQPPPLTILVKDHKKLREDGSRPGRPLCLAREAPNMNLGNLISDVLRRVSDSYESPTECISSEMMCQGIRDANSKIRQKII